MLVLLIFFFNDTATTEIYTLSLHDALPISDSGACRIASGPLLRSSGRSPPRVRLRHANGCRRPASARRLQQVNIEELPYRSEEHTSELQSRQYLVCRLLLEKKTKIYLLTAS